MSKSEAFTEAQALIVFYDERGCDWLQAVAFIASKVRR